MFQGDNITRPNFSQMAEALALIGLVSNILGFIQLGVQLVAVTQSLKAAGKIPNIDELDRKLDKIQIDHDRVRKRIASSKAGPSETDWNILKMARSCDEIVKQLKDLSKKLSTRPEAWSRTVDNARVAARFITSRGEIKDLTERLMGMDNMIRGYMQTALQRQVGSHPFPDQLLTPMT